MEGDLNRDQQIQILREKVSVLRECFMAQRVNKPNNTAKLDVDKVLEDFDKIWNKIKI